MEKRIAFLIVAGNDSTAGTTTKGEELHGFAFFHRKVFVFLLFSVFRIKNRILTHVKTGKTEKSSHFRPLQCK